MFLKISVEFFNVNVCFEKEIFFIEFNLLIKICIYKKNLINFNL